MFSLSDKVALVTGAGSGLGQAIAEKFAAAGAFVYCTDRNPDTAAGTAEQIRGASGQAADGRFPLNLHFVLPAGVDLNTPVTS